MAPKKEETLGLLKHVFFSQMTVPSANRQCQGTEGDVSGICFSELTFVLDVNSDAAAVGD